MLKIVLTIFICFIYCYYNAQYILKGKKYDAQTIFITKEKELVQLKLEKEEIKMILDSFISHEKENCDYNDTSIAIIFALEKESIDSGLNIQIASYLYKDIGYHMFTDCYGYFYYQFFLFLVCDEKDTTIFSITNKKKCFKYGDYSNEYLKKYRRIPMIKEPFTQWDYNYYKENVRLLFKGSFCK